MAREGHDTSSGSLNIKYTPIAHFSDKHHCWSNVRALLELIEDDPFTSADSAVRKLIQMIETNDKVDADIGVLETHVSLSQSQDGMGGPMALSTVESKLQNCVNY